MRALLRIVDGIPSTFIVPSDAEGTPYRLVATDGGPVVASSKATSRGITAAQAREYMDALGIAENADTGLPWIVDSERLRAAYATGYVTLTGGTRGKPPTPPVIAPSALADALAPEPAPEPTKGTRGTRS